MRKQPTQASTKNRTFFVKNIAGNKKKSLQMSTPLWVIVLKTLNNNNFLFFLGSNIKNSIFSFLVNLHKRYNQKIY